MNIRILLLIVALPMILNYGFAQETMQQPITNQIEQLKKEIEQLREELSIIKARLDSSRSGTDDRVERIEEQLEKRVQELNKKIDALSRSSAPTVLNPRTTAFINLAARTDSKTVFDATGSTEINDRPFLRSVELDLRAPVDPYADAITIISLEDEAGKGYAIDAEEAYGIIKRLPILEQAPLGLKFKIGKFRAPIGTNNKIHMHDLPWTTRPLTVSRYLGTEHGDFFESGYNPIGVDLNFYLPSPIPTTTFEMNFDIVRSGNLGLSGGRTGKQPAYISHLTLSKDWNNEHLLVLGGSVYDESGNNATRIWNADVTYKWAPIERRESHSFVAGGEAFWGRHSYLDSLRSSITNKPFGWFAYSQYQFSFWTYVGIRYEWLEEPFNDQFITKAWSAYISYYTTEFLRLRLGFQHLQSDALNSDLNNVNSVLFDINFVFGSHPTEPYWVNR